MTDITDKDIYHLWWEYLKRSESYQLFCAWHRERKEKPDLPLPEKLQAAAKDPSEHPLTYLFNVFLDVHAEAYHGQPYGFEVWWDRQKHLIQAIQNAAENDTRVRDFGRVVHDEMQSAAERLARCEGRPPSFNDFKGFFRKQLGQSMPPRLYLEIDLTAPETGPLLKEINEFILKEKKSVRVRAWQLLGDRTTWPTSPLVFVELKRYLMVYDLNRKGLKIQEIVRKVGTGSQRKNYSDENVQTVFREDLAKAERIIKNVEQGLFPGYYGKYSAA
jgi:hypothetical protein